MKIFTLILLFILFQINFEAFAQTTTKVTIPSPSPKEVIQADLGFTKIGIAYSRIMRRNRELFGEEGSALFPYGKIWRTGANDGTKITFNDDVIIKGKTVNKGTYVILLGQVSTLGISLYIQI